MTTATEEITVTIVTFLTVVTTVTIEMTVTILYCDRCEYYDSSD